MLIFKTGVTLYVLHQLLKHEVWVVPLDSVLSFGVVALAVEVLIVLTEELVINRSCVSVFSTKINHFYYFSFLSRCLFFKSLNLLFLFLLQLLNQIQCWMTTTFSVQVWTCRHVVLELVRFSRGSILKLHCNLRVNSFNIFFSRTDSLNKGLELRLHEL